MTDTDTNFVATGPSAITGVGVDARAQNDPPFTYAVLGMGTIGVVGVTPGSDLPSPGGGGTPDAGVVGFAFNSKNQVGSYGVLGNSDTGTGVVGYTAQGSVAISGTNQNNGFGVVGNSRMIDPNLHEEVDGSGTGVRGGTGTGVGVEGEASSTGYGGSFRSAEGIQLHIEPSQLKRHPVSGQAGDLFVDAETHLWYCHGGTNWKKLT
jgi:hypothetical protein